MCEQDEQCNNCLYAAIAVGVVVIYYLKRFFNGGVCRIAKDQSGRVFVITGCNTGIGKESARYIASLNATVVLANRSLERTTPLLNELQEKYGKEKIQYIRLDLNDLESVKQFAQDFKAKYQRLDVLLNNAGIMMLPEREETKQGFEKQFGTNHLGHFLLTGLLMDIIKKTPESRIVNVASLAQKRGVINFEDIMNKKDYQPMAVYRQSKLSNVMFSKYLQKKFDEKKINSKAVSLHPGVVRTELARYMTNSSAKKFLYNYVATPIFSFFSKSPFQGAQTNLQCSLEDFDKLEGGAYYADCVVTRTCKNSYIEADQARLFEISEKLVDFTYTF